MIEWKTVKVVSFGISWVLRCDGFFAILIAKSSTCDHDPTREGSVYILCLIISFTRVTQKQWYLLVPMHHMEHSAKQITTMVGATGIMSSDADSRFNRWLTSCSPSIALLTLLASLSYYCSMVLLWWHSPLIFPPGLVFCSAISSEHSHLIKW